MRLATFLLLLVVFGACGGDAPSESPTPAEAVVRDSSGIRIVENPDVALPRWTLSPQPVLSIGTLDGSEAETLFQVNDVERLSDGSWLVSNGGTQEVRVFDASGAYLRSIGGRGGGPGEFVSLSRIYVLPGDSLALYDSRQRRVTVFDPAGERVRDFGFDPLPQGQVSLFGRVASGAWGVRRNGGSYSAGGTGRGRAERSTDWHAIAGADGTTPDEFVELPDSESWVVQGDGFVSLRSIPFAPANGMESVGDRFVGGVTENAELRFWDADGIEVERWRVLSEPRPVTDEDWYAVRDRELADLDAETEGLPNGWRKAAEEFWQQVERPEVWPEWSLIQGSSDGEIWLSDYRVVASQALAWRVFDGSETLVREVETPEGFTVHWVGDGLVAGIERDDFDVEYLRVYEVVPAS